MTHDTGRPAGRGKSTGRGEGTPCPFEALTHHGQARRLRPLAVAALRDYPIQAARIALLHYEDNAVYRVTTAVDERFILRVGAAEGHGVAEQRAELRWLAALGHDTDLAVPPPVPTTRGAPLTLVDGGGVPEPRPCVLFRWVPGRPPTGTVRPEVVARIGAVTAQLHRHAEHFVPPPDFVRPSWGWERLFGASSALAGASLSARERGIVIATGARVREDLDALGTGARVWGLTHADLHRGNVLIDQGRVGVIDFDDCGWGYYLLDVATFLSSLRRVVSDTSTYAALRTAYVAGYVEVRALPALLDAHLRTFAVLRDMVIVNFILGSTNAQVQHWGPARVAGIMHDLERYLAGVSPATI